LSASVGKMRKYLYANYLEKIPFSTDTSEGLKTLHLIQRVTVLVIRARRHVQSLEWGSEMAKGFL